MDLLEYLKNNEKIVVAEGVLFEFVRRGRVRPGALVPEVVLDAPQAVRMLHQEFVDAGSDVVQAFTYYANRKKMADIGREGELEQINKKALQIAREVARQNGRLFAGGLCNSNIYDPDDPATVRECENMFTEQCRWAKEAGVDFMIAETFWDYGEASLALSVLKRFGLASVVTLCPADKSGLETFDQVPIAEALRRLEREGADVVGLNCQRGPHTMIPLIEKCRAVCQGPLACLPVCIRTDEEFPTMSRLRLPNSEKSCYPHDVQTHTVSHNDIRWFADECTRLGVNYVGLCCGNDPHFMRTLREALGKESKLDKYNDKKAVNSLVSAGPVRQRDLRKFTMG